MRAVTLLAASLAICLHGIRRDRRARRLFNDAHALYALALVKAEEMESAHRDHLAHVQEFSA